MGRLTTHILDTARGCPAQGVHIELFCIKDQLREKITESWTNADGRCDAPLLEGTGFQVGVYEVLFHAGPYLDQTGTDFPEVKFLDEIVIRFGIGDANEHYHVPLLLSPFSYSTYRGS